MRSYYNPPIVALMLLIFSCSHAQTYVPISVTGFNQDVIAEAGPSSLATTTKELDDPLASNKIMYSQSFAAFASIGGGLPDNGTLSSGGAFYQLEPYSSNNAMFVYRGETKNLDVLLPDRYSKLRVLCFATEANGIGGALVNISLSFTDGTTSSYITNYTLPDWFNATTNTVITGFGRCARVASAPWNADGLPSNPRMYYIEISLTCPDAAKNLQQVKVSNVTTAGFNAPFPNVVVMGVSGIPRSYSLTVNSTLSDCSGPNGSITVNATGTFPPYSYSWNTTPVQTGPTATGLAPGVSYVCTIMDANGCPVGTFTGTVGLNNNAAITASATPASICPGGSSQLDATVTTGVLTNFSWSPGALTGQTVNVTPAGTTTYTVTGTNAIGCSASAQVTVTVNAAPSPPVVNNVTVCSGANATLQVQSPQAGYTYNWYSTATGGTALASGTSYTVNNVTVAQSYYVEAVSGASCISNTRTRADISIQQASAPTVNNVTVCSGTNATLQVQSPQAGETYNWYTVATGGTPAGSGTSFTVNNVTAAATYYAEAVTALGCTSPSRGSGTVSVYPVMASPTVVVLNVSYTSVTFSWLAVPGATGYEVSTNGGITFQAPSSGATGLTHTVSGLPGNQTVTLVVRALGPQSCQTSPWSAAVSGTTLGTKEIFVPNVFTPNNDGKNDVLKVYGNLIAAMRFSIFNQWGEMIFSTQTVGSGWDGTVRGRQQPVGVYAYTLSVTLQDGTVINKKGAFNLIR